MWVLYYLKLACLWGVWISVIATFIALNPTAEGNETGSYCHCVFPWKCSIFNCNWPHSCYEGFELIFWDLVWFFFSPFPLRKKLGKKFPGLVKLFVWGFFFVLFLCFVLCLYDSEESIQDRKKRDVDRSTGFRKPVIIFLLCFAKQLKCFCGFCAAYI